MFKLNISGLKIIGREIKALINGFGNGSKQSADKDSVWRNETVHYVADNRRRGKNSIECHVTVLYGFLCYEYEKDGTIRVI